MSKHIRGTSTGGDLLAAVDRAISGEVIDEMLAALRCALADLSGIMPEIDPSGDREHSGWQTIEDIQTAIAKAEEVK
jgi:2-iminoacetate synthase ThiH